MILRGTQGPGDARESGFKHTLPAPTYFWFHQSSAHTREKKTSPASFTVRTTLATGIGGPCSFKGQDGQAGKGRSRVCQPVRGSYGIQTLCSEDAKHIKLVSVERAEVLGGVVHHGAKVLEGEEWVGEGMAQGQ